MLQNELKRTGTNSLEARYFPPRAAIKTIEMKTTSSCEIDLVKRASRDLNAFGELVERYRGSIIRQCYSRVRDRDYAEDLAQEVFVRAYTKLDQLNEPGLFPNWLWSRSGAQVAAKRNVKRQTKAQPPSPALQFFGKILFAPVKIPLSDANLCCIIQLEDEFFYRHSSAKPGRNQPGLYSRAQTPTEHSG